MSLSSSSSTPLPGLRLPPTPGQASRLCSLTPETLGAQYPQVTGKACGQGRVKAAHLYHCLCWRMQGPETCTLQVPGKGVWLQGAL